MRWGPEEQPVLGYLSELFDGIQGEGAFAGYHHAFVRLAGCSLGCRYCDTQYAQRQDGQFRVFRGAATVVKELDNPVEVGAVVKALKSLLETSNSISIVCVTGGEPLEQPHFLRQLLKTIEVFEVPVLLETNGVEHENLDHVIDLLELISVDIKLPSTSGRSDLWDRHTAFLRTARYKQVYVKMVIDESTELEEVEQAAKIIHETVDEAPVFLQPVSDAAGAPAISYRHIMELYEVCARYAKDIRVMPQVHKIIGSL